MLDKISAVAIITKVNSAEAESAAIKVAQLLANNKVSIFVAEPLRITNCVSLNVEELRKTKIDAAIAIGGDGTTLRAFRIVPPSTPLMSMNIGGHRGILSEVDTHLLDNAVKSMLAGKCFVESRIRIQPAVNDVSLPAALNDILITRINLTR